MADIQQMERLAATENAVTKVTLEQDLADDRFVVFVNQEEIARFRHREIAISFYLQKVCEHGADRPAV